MATDVVSGRVDKLVNRQAAKYIRAAEKTPADVIKTVWENIASTGEIPEPVVCNPEKDDAWQRFMSFRSSLPPATWLATLTDDQMKDMIAGRYA